MTTVGKLYLIGTPLGNRDDVTLRAINVLRELKVLFAEDTREIKKLLGLHGIPCQEKQIHSLAAHNEDRAIERALGLIQQGQDVGLTTDRGMPSISDPGADLVRAVRSMGGGIVPVPGPSAVTTLVCASGLRSAQFLFLGFLAQSKKEREEILLRSKAIGVPVVFFESPHRIKDSLRWIAEQFPSARLFWGREMTKMYEEYVWSDLDVLDFESVSELGEYTCLVEWPKASGADSDQILQDAVTLRLLSDREWSKKIGQVCDLSASEVYNALQNRKKSP